MLSLVYCLFPPASINFLDFSQAMADHLRLFLSFP